ncbi:hypothetical protein cypCar_00042926 [Cyprinus carpio]|nr:hypothetical protein cypCar_00042926 [Cyprinus carpio]
MKKMSLKLVLFCLCLWRLVARLPVPVISSNPSNCSSSSSSSSSSCCSLLCSVVKCDHCDSRRCQYIERETVICTGASVCLHSYRI